MLMQGHHPRPYAGSLAHAHASMEPCSCSCMGAMLMLMRPWSHAHARPSQALLGTTPTKPFHSARLPAPLSASSPRPSKPSLLSKQIQPLLEVGKWAILRSLFAYFRQFADSDPAGRPSSVFFGEGLHAQGLS